MDTSVWFPDASSAFISELRFRDVWQTNCSSWAEESILRLLLLSQEDPVRKKKKSFRYNSKFASHKKWGWCSTKKKGTRIICKLYACVIFKRRFQFFFFRPSHDGASRWRIRYFRPGNHNPVSRIIIIILYSNTYAYKHAAYLKRCTARLSLWKVPWLNFKNIKNNEKRA